MAVTNLLDRLAEEYEGNHPVEYRAPLAKLGNRIGRKVYELGGGSKGVSARDIIRKNTNEFPYDILKKKRDRQRVDPQNDYDFKIINKNNGDEHKIEVSSQNELDKKLDLYSAIFNTPKENLVVESNLKNPNVALRNKFQKHDFDKAFSGVRYYRDYDNYYEPAQDILNEPHLTKESYEAMVKKQNDKSRQHSANGWKRYVESRNASMDAGHELGKIFAKKNTFEKNVYGNIAAGNGVTAEPIPEGTKPKYALGNQNHVYSTEPHEKESFPMDIDLLQKSGHPVHYRKDGTPIIDAYTWTQIPNIGKIKNTGYLAIEGADTEKFHQGVKGQWTANVDSYPMNKNYENGIEIFGIGNNGENFNEDLLHTQVPLSWYQKAPVIHQGPKGWGAKVDIIQAKPGAPEVVVGEGPNRRLEKVATPAQFISHIPEDKMRKDWAPVWNKEMLPGSHPNKEDLGGTEEFIFGITGYPFGNSVDERKKAALKMANNDSYALKYAFRKVDKADKTALQRDADKAFLEDYVKRTSGNRTPYSLAWNTKNPPKQGKGAVDRGGGSGIFDFGDWKNSDKQYEPLTSQYPRTMEYLENKVLDEMSLGGLARNSSKPLLNDALAEIPYGADRKSLHSNLRNEYPSEFSKRTNDRTGINDVERYRSEKPFLNDIGFIVQRQGRKKTGFDELALSRAENDIYHNTQKYIGNTSKEKARKALDEAYKDMLEEDYQKFGNDAWKAYYKADSLDKVIGHTIGRRIGADRAKRGKKIF